MRTLVIPWADLQQLCDPAQLKEFWEPTQDPGFFHTTLALVFVQDIFSDCDDKSSRNNLEVSVTVVRKPAHLSAMTFSAAAIELLDSAEQTPTLLIIRLHTGSPLFLDCYYYHNRKHFSLIHVTGEDYCYGHPLCFVSAELLSKYEPGKNYSPRAKLPPLWQKDPGTTFPVHSCVRDYRDWTTGYPSIPAPEVHFIWLSTSFMPFPTKPGEDFHLPDNMLGLPPVSSWPLHDRPIPWVLDPAEHPRLMTLSIAGTPLRPVAALGMAERGKGKERAPSVTSLRSLRRELGRMSLNSSPAPVAPGQTYPTLQCQTVG